MFFMALTAGLAACTSCKSDKPHGPQPTAFEQQLEAKDTVAVEDVIKTFFNHIENKQYFDAAAMLYTRKDTSETPRVYSNEEMQHFADVYKILPYAGYKIDYMKFLSPVKNEVACSMILQKGQNGQPDAVTKLFFTPVMVDGKWCLILTDSKKFEEPITDFEQRDSLNQRYENYKKSQKPTR